MEWLKELFVEHSALQAVVVVSLISTIGIGLGKIRFFGISLGTAFIFFVGILAGHFGLSLDPAMLTYAESFGLVIFVYALGLQVGPGFFSSMRADGLRLVSPAIAIVLLGTALAMAMSYAFGVSMPDMSGILCGATTNTPALGAAQQTLQQMGIDANGAALSCAVAYPLGVVGVILAVVFLRKLFVRPCDMPGPDAEHRKNVFIASYHLTNPAVFGKSVHEIATQSHHHFVISRLWRDGRVSIPTSDKTLQENDLILVITTPGEADALRLIFGEQETKDWNTENIDWNSVDSQLISQRILVTRPEINGKKLSQLRLRNTYGINISRVYRSGVQLLATPDLRLQLGDRLTVVGEAEAIRNVEKILGNAVKSLNEPNLAAVFIGLILGTLPSLWAEAGAQGRGRGAYLSCAASFLALSAVLLYAQYGAFYTMRPGFLGFLFCGLLWGLSLIVPGMTSSSILMAVGLFTPMAEGFARLDMAVILPWLLGMALIVLTLARVVNWCFQTHYPLFYHAVFGIVLASTVVIIPLRYDGARDALLCLLAAALGALAAYLSAKLQPKEDA